MKFYIFWLHFLSCYLRLKHLCWSPGLIREPKYSHLKELHRAIKLCEAALVSADPTVTSLGTYHQVRLLKYTCFCLLDSFLYKLTFNKMGKKKKNERTQALISSGDGFRLTSSIQGQENVQPFSQTTTWSHLPEWFLITDTIICLLRPLAYFQIAEMKYSTLQR